MSIWGRFNLCSVTIAGLLVLNGCLPSGSSPLDDEKESHYVLGKSRVNAMDYSGAVEAFSQSLEVNPRSAAAHFQLACLFDTKVSDPAAAVYHYQEFLRLNPKADNAEVIKQRIYSCKQQLAADVLPLPSAPAAQRQLEDLAEKNRQLQSEVEKWRAYYETQRNQPQPNPPPLQTSIGTVTRQPANDVTAQNAGSAPTSTTTTTTAARPAKPRTHVVAAGDTFASIARKYGVSLTSLQSANPGVNPKKLKVGQSVSLPGQ